MQYLKQSTATTIAIGPFLDDTDGKTPETGLTISQADVILNKHNSTTFAQKNDATSATHRSNGWYTVPIDTTDTNTLGRLVVAITETGALPVWHTFEVLAANIYDSLVGGGANLKIDVETIKTQTVTAAGAVTVLASVGTAATSTAQTGDSFVRIGAPAGASVSADVAAVKADTAAIKTKTDFLPSATAGAAGGVFIAGTNAATTITTALTANITGNLSGSVGSVTAAVTVGTNNDKTGYGLSGAAVQAIWDALTSALTTVGSIGKKLADWVIGTAQTGDSFARLGAPVGASISADVAAVKAAIVTVQADTDDIQTRLPAALVSGRIDASVGAVAASAITSAAIATDAFTAAKFAADAKTKLRSIVSGTAQSGSTTTLVDTARTEADTDYWKGCIILVTSGSSAGEARLITVFDAATDTLTFAPALTQAISTNTYEILPGARADVGLWNGTLPNVLLSGRVDASVGSYPGNSPQTGDSFARLGAPAGASVSADVAAVKADTAATLTAVDTEVAAILAAVDTEVGAIKTKTDFLPSATAGAAGGLFIAGSNAATSITTALTANVIGNVTGNLSGSVGSVTGAVGSVTAAVTVGTNNDKTGYGLSAAAVQAIWDALTSAFTTAGSIGKKLADWVLGSDNKVILSNNAHTGAVIPTVTTVTTTTTTTNLTNAPTAGDLTATMKTSVKTQVTDALAVDTYAEPSAPPAATATLKDKVGWMAALSRNKITQTATTQLLRNDGDAATIGTSTHSDDATTHIRGKFA
jgi:hypothetical protein